MRIEKNTILIQVNPNYEYDTEISKIGEPSDIDTLSMWSWINHLWGKNWGDKEKEEEFIILVKNIYGKI